MNLRTPPTNQSLLVIVDFKPCRNSLPSLTIQPLPLSRCSVKPQTCHLQNWTPNSPANRKIGAPPTPSTAPRSTPPHPTPPHPPKGPVGRSAPNAPTAPAADGSSEAARSRGPRSSCLHWAARSRGAGPRNRGCFVQGLGESAEPSPSCSEHNKHRVKTLPLLNIRHVK